MNAREELQQAFTAKFQPLNFGDFLKGELAVSYDARHANPP
tara:strand:- start:114 stop:236 length:123 start_codon:yes stop_codon:yes gene_type:complete